jgi:RNA polymerase sigma-70 factor (sigma-E family)
MAAIDRTPARSDGRADPPPPGGEAFDAAYARLWPTAIRLARLMTGSGDVAEEVAQDAFLGLHRHWERVDNPDGYLRTAVVNGCRDVARRRRRPSPPPEAEPAVLPPEIDETWAALRRLPDRQRAAIVLRFYEDLSTEEIARLLGCRPGTVKSAINRGLTQLRRTVR